MSDRKNISMLIKGIGIALVALACLFPVFSIDIKMAWQGGTSPVGPVDDFESNFITLTPLGAQLTNITYDETSYEFSTDDVDPNSEMYMSVNGSGLVLLLLTMIGGIFIVLGLLFNFLKEGPSKLSAIFSIFGSIPLLLEFLLAAAMPSIFQNTFVSLGYDITGNTGILVTDIGTSTLIQTTTINGGFATFLLLFAVLATIGSLFFKSKKPKKEQSKALF
jgi:hypothetical protein